VQNEDLKREVKKQKQKAKKGDLQVVGIGKWLNQQKERNLNAAWKWDVIDCGDCYWLELWPSGNGLGGETLVCDCDVDLNCNDLHGQEGHLQDREGQASRSHDHSPGSK
jgi:hypothetical protein